MKKLFAYRNYYTSQLAPHDCGIACLSMILNYTGRFHDAYSLSIRTPVPVDGLSLLALHDLARAQELSCKCVRMDVRSLGELSRPCILHTKDAKRRDHYIVCFGKTKRRDHMDYLIGDPAIGLNYITQFDLETIWVSRTALYFDELIPHERSIKPQLGYSLLRFKAFKKVMFFNIPLLNAFSLILGIAFSWMLQRGITTSITDSKLSLIVSLMVLLLLITLFKSVINYIRQRVLIKLNAAVSLELNAIIFKKLFKLVGNTPGNSEAGIKMAITDIRKIQNALTAFVTALIGEGTLIIAILAGLWYYEPISGLINTLCLLLTGYLSVAGSLSTLFDTSKLRWHTGYLETALLAGLNFPVGENLENKQIDQFMSANQQAMTFTSEFANKLVKQGFWNECIATTNVLTVFAYGLYANRVSAISYDKLIAVVVLSYFLTVLQSKVANALGTIFEGATLADRYQRC
ncbi:cysteine peptidase family C39 domain-containing protein [Mucilaginibacter sp. UYCu711]|uniref:cysteine peptidase family C39 domain-containing protein n=1 Tax=Mucilaginibacter sp. UYCu711 TaxID=3156339 RepID=UPI003D21E2C5